MSSKKDAPGFSSLKHNWGLASRASDKPENPKPETTKITAQRNAAAAFGVSPDRAGREKKSTQRDQRSERRKSIESRLGISLGDKPASKSSSGNITRAFGGTNTNEGGM
ncbi:hypothetical protein [Ruegeria arenilitoris]|uniref:hypothetical protein n=1 Tax=Ruegeria arenilitoris TaxID=1173585 RepID=UPI00147FD815|nr:hypothetical protein [Ruegeria arenilitoris]